MEEHSDKNEKTKQPINEPKKGYHSINTNPEETEVRNSEPKLVEKNPEGARNLSFIAMSMDSKLDDDQYSTKSNNVYDTTRYNELVKAILQIESEEKFLPEETPADLNALPVKEYLDATVIPILIEALQYLGTYRPPEPINALCVYLLKYRDMFEPPKPEYDEPEEINPEEDLLEPESELEPEEEPDIEVLIEKLKKGKI